MKLTALQIMQSLTEELDSPLAKPKVTLQYRPYQTDSGWRWFWVLLPDDRQKALASGEADNRAEAATDARASARELRLVINRIDILMPEHNRHI